MMTFSWNDDDDDDDDDDDEHERQKELFKLSEISEKNSD